VIDTAVKQWQTYLHPFIKAKGGYSEIIYPKKPLINCDYVTFMCI